jgi:replication factor C subunit 1
MRKKQEKDEQAIRKAAEELEKKEREVAREEKKRAKEGGPAPKKKVVDVTSKLWTDRYAPSALKEVCGNKTGVEKLLLWLQEW